MRLYADRYRALRDSMALGLASIPDIRERIQVALTLALTNARAGGDPQFTELHARFAADASVWLKSEVID